MIVNNGKNNFFTVYPFSHCNVGTGTPVLNASTTGLTAFAFNVTGRTTLPSSTVTRNYTDNYAERTIYYGIDNIASPATLTEVSLGVNNTATNITTIDFIRDINGNPTSVQVLAGDSLVVTAKVRLYANVTPINGTINANQDLVQQSYTVVPYLAAWDITGTNYIGFSTTTGATFYTGAFNADVSVAPSGTVGASSTTTYSAYTPGNYYRDVTYAFNAGSGNVGTVLQIVAGNTGCCPIKIGLNPGFTKSNSYTASLTVRFSWWNP